MLRQDVYIGPWLLMPKQHGIQRVKEYLSIIRPYLSDIIYDHKTQGKWKIHSSNSVIEFKTEGE